MLQFAGEWKEEDLEHISRWQWRGWSGSNSERGVQIGHHWVQTYPIENLWDVLEKICEVVPLLVENEYNTGLNQTADADRNKATANASVIKV